MQEMIVKLCITLVHVGLETSNSLSDTTLYRLLCSVGVRDSSYNSNPDSQEAIYFMLRPSPEDFPPEPFPRVLFKHITTQ